MSLGGKNPYSFIFTHLPCCVLLTPFCRSKFPHGFVSLQPEAFSSFFFFLIQFCCIFHLSEKVFILLTFRNYINISTGYRILVYFSFISRLKYVLLYPHLNFFIVRNWLINCYLNLCLSVFFPFVK